MAIRIVLLPTIGLRKVMYLQKVSHCQLTAAKPKYLLDIVDSYSVVGGAAPSQPSQDEAPLSHRAGEFQAGL
ncbi:unnamed protein product [Cylicostephanus goldi]|uniref:Uncharacterized protein n=1 Tax=Cylicostephanus goldi TaxID=71465 RepID=A0A3P6RD44_CYLGO|nr:unnamed protein product [Cylicostephanus goldi]